jgi:hypothetical protein
MKEYRHENVHCTIISIRRRRHISIIRIVVSKDARIVKRRSKAKRDMVQLFPPHNRYEYNPRCVPASTIFAMLKPVFELCLTVEPKNADT